MKIFYITTSIAYVNAEPHIGHLFELLAADVLKRYHQSRGEGVFFLTGTDEHGIKVAQAAEKAGKKPREYVDEISKKFEQLGQDFNIDFDYFIRTTNPEHVKFVQEKWRQLAEAGVLKKKKYTGLYCQGCEAFKTEAETVDGKCAIHEKEVEKIEEENWFLEIKNQKSKIKDWIETSVFPESRRQEAINILESGAYDEVSVSRSKERYGWGIAVPDDPTQIMYVWADALFNYLSALKINNKENLWPADVQIIGKDILKFHAIIWPALLLACGYELPKKLLVHGFINVDGKKMSKSLGNVIAPSALKERYGVDGTRYLVLRQLSFFDDSNFVWSEFDAIYNGELANGIGNLLARLVGLARKFGLKTDDKVTQLTHLKEWDFHQELVKVNQLIKETDTLITENSLWVELEKKRHILEEAINNLLIISVILEPFMPETALEIRFQLRDLDPKPLFPRLTASLA